MRICHSKADLKKCTMVEVSEKKAELTDCIVLDGCAVLWIVPWLTSSPTKQAVVSDYVKSFNSYVQQKLRLGNVYVVFDRYLEFSTKGLTQKARSPGGYKVFQLSANSPLPLQKQVLNVMQNKKQLIKIIVETHCRS